MPSAVFWSVTGLPTFSVTALRPSAYEPPAIATFALVVVAETRWKSGFAVGKSFPTLTVSAVAPFTEIFAELAGSDGVFGVVGTGVGFGFGVVVGVGAGVVVVVVAPPVVPGDAPVAVPPPAPCCANGSFDTNRPKSGSCPSCGCGATS